MTKVEELPNISDYKDLSNLPYLLVGIFIVDVIVLFLAKYNVIGGKTLNDWYDKFGLLAVIADVISILIGFILGQIIYTHFIMPYYGWNPIIFILLIVFIQIMHDILFYFFVVLPIPKGHNSIIDMFKIYAENNKDNKTVLVVSNSMMMIGSAFITFMLKSLPDYATSSIGIVTIYTLPYILSTKQQ